MKYLPYILLGISIIVIIYFVNKKENNNSSDKRINFYPNRVKIY